MGYLPWASGEDTDKESMQQFTDNCLLDSGATLMALAGHAFPPAIGRQLGMQQASQWRGEPRRELPLACKNKASEAPRL